MLSNLKKYLNEISFDAYKSSLRNNLKNGYSGLILSGAEVTLSKNLLRFARYARNIRHFKHIQIQTNGRKLANPDFCKKLIQAGINEFFISIYGPNPGIHERITLSKNSFYETLTGIENINKFNAKIITNTVITSLNYEHLPDIPVLLCKYLNVKEIQFWNYWSMNEKDTKNLLASFSSVRPFLIKAVQKCISFQKSPMIKYFPGCRLGSFSRYIHNDLSDTVIDKKYWDAFDKNQWNCIFSDRCSLFPQKCAGLPIAYINKFGWKEANLTPQ
jgi:MoaA/NifB/PqqE/SkfB family radical SAM enzyme